MILAEEHVMMKKVFRDFAESEFTKELQERLDSTGEFDWDIHKEMAKYGFMGARIPEEYGGQGGDTLTYVLMLEEFARVCPVLAIYPNTPNSLGGGPLMACGTEEQKKKYLPLIATGKKKLCFALTEPGAGSDASGTTTKAVEDGNDFIINGRKTFISGAPVSDYAIVYAKTDPSQKGNKGISMFIVDLKLPGVSFGKPERKMGINGYPTSDIVFDNVRVSKDDLLGPLHNGFTTAMKTLGIGRLGVSAQALGIAQGCLEMSIKHAKEREQFGRPLAKFQAISFMLADMATEIALARELIYNTAVEFDAGEDVAAKLSMCKYFATEMANRVAYKAVQIHGGYGYIKEYPVERMYRDARITTLYEGTSQIQQLVISRNLLK
ncbi:acyl-CoA dehydrogenase family protein [Megasphaera sp. DJF_B143]|uniref:acyl-CoA dehydrogenase family protein n=1 Tax=Megasphaera sp. DJF_B143 TaxID=537288 RepID=UPI00073F495B|nr:acyl-CoA dehydrogenase family protein [Megasphaera sp. DJF_B143]KUH56582.1 acyl-CoA dehydrogenase [Megasphaera sp. DJF_B143]